MKSKVVDWCSGRLFNFVHSNNLVYNTCWEDPRLDRQALKLGSDDNVMVITSAGCNALDYALDAPNHIYAVDMNPRQNALLELKLAGIRALDFETFFSLFGEGRVDDFQGLYFSKLRDFLPPFAQAHWDKHLGYFDQGKVRKSFYFRGTSGTFARLVNYYIDLNKLRSDILAIFSATSLGEQYRIYHSYLRDELWTGFFRWAMSFDATLSLLGVPRPQRKQVEGEYPGGIVKFMEDCVETVFTRLPLNDNYFWWLYFMGQYSQERCPEYLKPENFQRLKDGLVDRISTHTSTIHAFLENHSGEISRYLLLDHMDWLSCASHPTLVREWQAIVNRATNGAKVLFRSGGLKVEYVDPIPVTYRGKTVIMKDILDYEWDLAARLHQRDRVHTYGSFYIANLPVN